MVLFLLFMFSMNIFHDWNVLILDWLLQRNKISNLQYGNWRHRKVSGVIQPEVKRLDRRNCWRGKENRRCWLPSVRQKIGMNPSPLPFVLFIFSICLRMQICSYNWEGNLWDLPMACADSYHVRLLDFMDCSLPGPLLMGFSREEY